MQLVAYGAQDIYLTANPEHTLFKAVYVRVTNFAAESIEQTFNGNVALGKRVTAEISRNGDLIKDMWLECEFTYGEKSLPVYGLGNALVKQAEIEIGGQLIDRQYGEWMNIWSELTVPAGKRVGYDEMVGNFADGEKADLDTEDKTKTNEPKRKLDVPLQFWFNRNPGLALPLIALQYHQVKLNLDLESAANLDNAAKTEDRLTLNSCKLYVDYIFLDTDERRKFAQVSHEYLIEEVQFTGDETLSSTKRVDLSFNHPVKALYWVAQTTTQVRGGGDASQPCQFTALSTNEALTDNGTVKLQLNGQDRFSERRHEYFLRQQAFKHHTSGPRANRALNLMVKGNANEDSNLDELEDLVVRENCAQFIYMYSFALNPERHQPTGTCNFSRIDTATLVLNGVPSGLAGSTSASTPGTLKVFALSYNVLRIMSGMGGKAYAS